MTQSTQFSYLHASFDAAYLPGYQYLLFLQDIFEFLGSHPNEIVMFEVRLICMGPRGHILTRALQIKKDGFVVSNDVVKDGVVVAYSMVPSVEELAECLERAKTNTASDVVSGSAKDLERPIGQLIDENRRLIIIDRV